MKRPPFVWLGVLFLVGTVFFSAAAEAAMGSRLVYGRAAGNVACPDESELRAAVRARLGYDPFFPWADQTIVVHVALRQNRRLTGKVYLVDSLGRASPEREFTTSADECGELVLALALAIVMTLDPLHGTTAAPTPSTRAAAASVPAAGANGEARGSSVGTNGSGEIAAVSAAVANDANRPSGASDSASGRASAPTATRAGAGPDAGADRRDVGAHRLVNLDVGGGALASSGTMPGVSAGFVPFLRARRSDVSLAVEGRFELLAWSSASGDHANVSLAGGAVVPCFHLAALVGCAPLLLARYRAAGADVAPREATAFFAATGIRVGAEIPVGSGAWGFIRAEGLVNFTRHELMMAGESLWRVPAASFTLSAGALVSIL